MDQDHWTQVATAASQVEAEMLRDLLVSEGIGSLVQTSDAAAYLGVMSPSRILVRQADLTRAAAFLDAWESAEVLPVEGAESDHQHGDEHAG